MGGIRYCGDASGELSGTSRLQCLEYTIYPYRSHRRRYRKPSCIMEDEKSIYSYRYGRAITVRLP